MRWRGHLDFVDRERIAGWACDEDRPDNPVTLRILDNSTLLGQVLANQFRADLKAAGIGDGRHAFSLRVPGGLAPERRHLIAVQRADDGYPLAGSPYILEAADLAATVVRNALPASWRGNLDIVTRDRIEGWAFQDKTPQTPVALAILDNGEVIARTLANRFREDLENAGMGGGHHAFTANIARGLSPLTRHVIQVLGEADGCEMPGSPVTIEAATSFDAALEQAVSTAVSALSLPAERERVLVFLAAQTERLLHDSADAAAGREARLIQRQFARRWGTAEGRTAASSSKRPSLRALVVDDLMPAVSRDAASAAILSHIRALQTLGYAVSFVAAEELSPPATASAELEALGIECCRAPYYASVEEVLRRQTDSFELVYLHRISNAAKYLFLARRYCHKAHILYGVSDLHNLRVARQAKVEGRKELLEHSRGLRLAECAAACTASAIVTHSWVEAAWLRRAVAGCNVHVVPWAVPVRPTKRPWSERRGIAFIAHYRHSANLDAARYLAAQIMPRVRREDSRIECLLVGSSMPDSIMRLSAPGVVPLGDVPDLSTIYERVRLTVAPLRFGAGVKGKVLESFAAGVPCVMSPVAAEGIALTDVLTHAIAADAPQMAALIVRLYSNEAESQALRQAGLACIGAGYGEEAVVAGLKAAIDVQRAPVAPDAAVGKTAKSTL